MAADQPAGQEEYAEAVNTPARRTDNFFTEWLLLIGGLLLLGGFLAYSLLDERAAIDHRERERLAAQAKVIHDNLGRQLDAINRALLNVREELPQWNAQKDGMTNAVQRLKAFADAMTGVRTMTILDADGNIRAASRADILPGTNFRERAYFQAVLKNPDPDTFYISAPFKTSLGAWGINAVRMVPGARGEFSGVVAATLDPEEFKILLDSVRYAPDMWSAIAHGDGPLFLMMPEREEQVGKNLLQPGSFFTRHKESGQSATVMSGIVYTTGEHRMMAQHTVQPAALKMDKPLVVAIGRETNALHARWLSAAYLNGGLFTLLALITVPGLLLSQWRRRIAARDAALAENALRDSRERLAVATDSAGIGVWELDLLAHRLLWDEWMHRIYGIAPNTFSGRMEVWRSCVHEDDLARMTHEVENAILARGNLDSEFRIIRPDGEVRHIKVFARVICTGDGTPARMIGVNYDITEDIENAQTLEKLNAQLREQSELLRAQAFLDGLTGVANRRRFDESFDAEWRRCRRDGSPLALLMIDIDHFKLFNDRYGHQAGDACLKSVAATLKEQLGRSHDLVARYGGEEFVCLLPECDLAGARAKAEEFRIAIESLGIPHEDSPTARMVTISVGVAAALPENEGGAGQLLANADAALYAAKSGGRNRVSASA